MGIKNIQTAHLVHDLKNPVNIIETGARSLLEKQKTYGPLNPKQEKIIKRILRNSAKIRNLTNSMLEVDKAALGIVESTDCNLMALIKDALMELFDLVEPSVSEALDEASDAKTMSHVLSENGVQFEADEAQLNRTVKLDGTKFCLVITNLLSNAFKYREKNVFLRCTAEGDTITVAVRDDGPGIPECYHQQIFDQYFQCVKVDGFPVRGHGLGLAGALALTEAMGGTLSLCHSSRGAEFVVQVMSSR